MLQHKHFNLFMEVQPTDQHLAVGGISLTVAAGPQVLPKVAQLDKPIAMGQRVVGDFPMSVPDQLMEEVTKLPRQHRVLLQLNA